MDTINIHEVKTHLSRLVEKAARGEAFVIAKSGRPIAKVALDAPESGNRKRLGFLEGEIEIPDDFNEMAADEIALLFGGGKA